MRMLAAALVTASALVLALASAMVLVPEVSVSLKEGAPPVHIALYYESLCPGCREFITTQLVPTWDLLKNIDPPVLKVTLYPFGNAEETQDPDGSWTFTCQHGEKECLGNQIEACLLDRASKLGSTDKALAAIRCLEEAKDPISVAKKCIDKETQGIKYDDIIKCAEGAEGNALHHAMGLATGALIPPHKYVPWIVADGVHTDDVQKEAEENLLGFVCQRYSGKRPDQCGQKKHPQKEVPHKEVPHVEIVV